MPSNGRPLEEEEEEEEKYTSSVILTVLTTIIPNLHLQQLPQSTIKYL
jgi:hypothetical protein